QTLTVADLALAEGELSQQFAQMPPEQRRAAALSAAIEIKVMAAQAVTTGLDKDPDFQRRMAFLQQRALHGEMVEKDVVGKVTDAEVHARHILVKSKEEADAIIKQLDGGADFQKLANEHTSDPSGKTSGGDLGWFGPGQMVPEFDKAVFALAVGKYTEQPVQSQFGWHVIQVEDKRAKQPPAFDQVKDQARQAVIRDKYIALVKSLRAEAKVEISDEKLKKTVDALENTK
ncbi:MAG: peptidylprolyl isomerase, partial [Mesorhizobium sp.]